jgi:hypothetical protein
MTDRPKIAIFKISARKKANQNADFFMAEQRMA